MSYPNILLDYPEHEAIPENLLKGYWKELAIEVGPQGPRIIKHYFELFILRKLMVS